MIWGLIGGILLSLLASEIYDSCPRLTMLLLRFASRRIPAECRDRYWEEWLGELDAQEDLGKLRKLVWALWVFLSSWKTGRTLHSAIEQTKRLTLARQREHVVQRDLVFDKTIWDMKSWMEEELELIKARRLTESVASQTPPHNEVKGHGRRKE